MATKTKNRKNTKTNSNGATAVANTPSPAEEIAAEAKAEAAPKQRRMRIHADNPTLQGMLKEVRAAYKAQHGARRNDELGPEQKQVAIDEFHNQWKRYAAACEAAGVAPNKS